MFFIRLEDVIAATKTPLPQGGREPTKHGKEDIATKIQNTAMSDQED